MAMNPRIALLDIGRPCHWLKAPNFGLLFIVAYLERHLGIKPQSVVYVDQPAGDDVIDKLSRHEWDILGVSSHSVTAYELNQLAPEIRKRWPERCVVLGGVHMSAVPEVALRQSQIRYGVIGDGEKAFAGLVSGLGEGGTVLRDTPGLVWLEDGTLRDNGLRAEPVADLDELPPLALDILNRSHYFSDFMRVQGTDIPVFPWIATRGCASRCRYCAVNVTCGRGVRYQSAARIVSDMERLVRDYGAPGVYFQDDDLASNRNRLIDLCEGTLRSSILRGVKWACYARVDRVDIDLLKLMKRAGCVQVGFGFESGSERTLAYLKKAVVTVEEGRRAIAACKEAGLRVMGSFMVGSPTETREDVLATFAFIHKNPIDFVLLFTTTPSPGSEFWHMAVERGLIDPYKLDWRGLHWDNWPVLADSVDPHWLFRRYYLEYFRNTLRNYNYSPLLFVRRVIRAMGLRISR
jgi:anaerobic magnesium-protoporphyrin IX monomethyl ester cyclase